MRGSFQLPVISATKEQDVSYAICIR